ncbi:tumor necrosis factor receptor superfamily member 14 [Patagioenas fasciata monilis]|uniref:Tumor necrosis factor receptor superfamily member 14 n=1 Tax=Patagioenas fasciata monilis TaxID=372326 RepID=A0A1V4KRG6_PATFA|nr:tumor necrosis factor receptor superfamily member 14 [Patagioenas fasciata monilis]
MRRGGHTVTSVPQRARSRFGPVRSQSGCSAARPEPGTPQSRVPPEADPSPAEPRGAWLRAEPRPVPSLAANGEAPRPAQPGASRAQPGRGGSERAERSRAEPDRTERSRTGAGPSGTGAVRKGSEELGAVPGCSGGCRTPCPPTVTELCGHTDTHTPPCTNPPGAPVTTGDASPATPKFAPPPPEATGRDIIPVYCSLLAAVVVGLLAYVAFKCWHTCRQKQQLAKARAGDVGTSPDGEKLQSDSGVFLDTPGLQEPHPPSKAPHPQGHPLGAVSPQRQEELERLLESGGTRGHQLRPVTAGPQGSDVTSAV